MAKKSSTTAFDFGVLWLRVFMGTGIAYHGYGKVFGGHMAKMIEGVGHMGFPYPEVFAWAAALSEFLGGILIVLGLFTRPAAFFVACTMTVAAFVAHAKDPLATKELALAYLVMAVTVLILGAGQVSADSNLKNK